MAEKITGNMSITSILEKHPETAPIFQKHGFHCMGCAIASFETLEQGAAAHGIDVKALLEDLNKAAGNKKAA